MANMPFADVEQAFAARGPPCRDLGRSDVRSGSVKCVASALGEGSVIIWAMHQYFASLREAAMSANGDTATPKQLSKRNC